MADGDNTQTVTRPEWLPETHWDAAANAPKLDVIGKDYGELGTLRTLKTEHETRAASLPKTAADYKLELPAEVKLPDGYTWNPADKDARETFAPFLEVFRAAGMSQDDITKVVGLWANLNIKGMNAERESEAASKAEREAAQAKLEGELGDKGKDRLGAIGTWAKANFSQEFADGLASLIASKADAEKLEAVIGSLGGIKLAGLPANGAAKPDLSAMTPRQKLDYANAEAAKAAKH